MPLYRHLLWPFAILYGILVWFRNRLFDLGSLRSASFDVPIICVGNLEMGGTGKSPMVMYLLNLLQSNGFKVAVLSRGYRRNTRGFVLADEQTTPEEIGDEAMQIKQRSADALLAVCENRVEGVIKLLSVEPEPDVIIMDDGFQHRWLKPNLSVMVTSGKFPFWKNFLLPVGTLREAKNEAKRADILVISKSDGTAPKGCFDGPIFYSEITASKLVQISGDQMDAGSIGKVLLFSGIGNPDRFLNTAKEQFQILEHVTFSDHHNYKVNEFKLLRKKIDIFGANVSAVLTTEKDAMRLKGSPLLNELEQIPVFYLPIDISIVGNESQIFDKLILEHVRKDK